jgi:hypothetical protein
MNGKTSGVLSGYIKDDLNSRFGWVLESNLGRPWHDTLKGGWCLGGLYGITGGSCQSVSRLLGATSRFGDVNGDADEGLAIVSGMTLTLSTGRLCTRRAGVNLSGSIKFMWFGNRERRKGPYLRSDA